MVLAAHIYTGPACQRGLGPGIQYSTKGADQSFLRMLYEVFEGSGRRHVMQLLSDSITSVAVKAMNELRIPHFKQLIV